MDRRESDKEDFRNLGHETNHKPQRDPRTYYLKPRNIHRLDFLRVYPDGEKSDFVNEALEDLFEKYRDQLLEASGVDITALK